MKYYLSHILIIFMFACVSPDIYADVTDSYAVTKEEENGMTIIKQKDPVNFLSEASCFIRGYAKKKFVPRVLFRLIDIIESEKNYIRVISDKAKRNNNKLESILKLNLSNGESLTFKCIIEDSRNGMIESLGFCSVFIDLSDLVDSRSDVKSLGVNEKIKYTASKLQAYDIKNINVDGYSFTPKSFESSKLFRKILPVLLEVSGVSTNTGSTTAPKPTPTPNTVPKPTPPASSYSSNPSPTGEIEKVWTDLNVFENWQKGIRIHVKFRVKNLLGKRSFLCAFFYFANGEKVPSTFPGFTSPNGQATVQSEFTPKYDDSIFNDYTLFIPYSAFYLRPGFVYSLKYNVEILSNGKNIAFSQFINFNFS